MRVLEATGGKVVVACIMVVSVGTLLGTTAGLRLKRTSTTKRIDKPRAEAARAPAAENIYIDSNGDEWTPAQRTAAIAAMVAWWDAHKEHCRHLLKEELPAAIIRRNAAIPPDLDAIMAFPRSYLPSSSVHDAEAHKHKDAQYEQCWRQLNDFGIDQGELSLLAAYGRALTDDTPVGQELNVSTLTRLELANEPSAHWFRSTTATVERAMFGDEDAAQRVEAVQTGDDLAAYLQDAQERFQAKAVQIYEHAGFDEQSCDYLLDERRVDVANRIIQFYRWNLSREVNAINAEWDDVGTHINEELVAASSRDDAVSRRLLTELQEAHNLFQAAHSPPTPTPPSSP